MKQDFTYIFAIHFYHQDLLATYPQDRQPINKEKDRKMNEKENRNHLIR